MSLADPPHAENPSPCHAIQAMLSEYVDGVLPSGATRQVQTHLEGCTVCLEVVGRFKRVQATLADSDDARLPDNVDFSGMWGGIASILEQDRAICTPCTYDDEFISTYLDREFSHQTGSVDDFESHLPACEPCNEKLAQGMALSALLKQWDQRLELSLEDAISPLNFPKRVMAGLQQDEAQPKADWAHEEATAAAHCCEIMLWETLSAYLDQELSQKEMMGIGAHLEACPPCQRALANQATMQAVYRNWSARLEAEAPAVAESVMKALRAQTHVVAGPRKWFSRSAWVAVPTAAAAIVLLMVSSEGFIALDTQEASFQKIAASQSAMDFPQADRESAEEGLAQEQATARTPAEASGEGESVLAQDDPAFNENADGLAKPTVSGKTELKKTELKKEKADRAQDRNDSDRSTQDRSIVAWGAPPSSPEPGLSAPSPAESSRQLSGAGGGGGASGTLALPPSGSNIATVPKSAASERPAMKASRANGPGGDPRGRYRGSPTAEEYLYKVHHSALSDEEVDVMMGATP